MSDTEQTNKEQTHNETQEFLFWVKLGLALQETPREKEMRETLAKLEHPKFFKAQYRRHTNFTESCVEETLNNEKK